MEPTTQRPPVRIVHLGLGAFHRAHQAWYTQQADPSWGIAAFSGRSRRLADVLTAQDCRYTLIERGPDTDAFHAVSSLVFAGGAEQTTELERLVAEPEVAVITLTITERGYLPGPESPAPHRLLRALDARRRAGSGPIAVVPCDNVRGNGGRIRATLLELADAADPALARWLVDQVSFVDTVSDRITPAATDEDEALVAARTGGADRVDRVDRAPVVAEPFAEWVLAGEFPAGRPAWEHAGARFVKDIAPFEQRKLRLLNGGHLLLALTGLRHGHRTVAEAVADPVLRGYTEAYWSAAARAVPEADDYLRQLRSRFANARINHRLEQIALDAEAKLKERVVPVVDELLADGLDPSPAVRVVAAWLEHAGSPRTGARTDAALDGLAPGWSTDRALRRALDSIPTTTESSAR